jgi:hypothetical protein
MRDEFLSVRYTRISSYHGSSDAIRNKCSSGKSSLMGASWEVEGRSEISSARTKGFFSLGSGEI